MPNAIEIARRVLLSPTGIDEPNIEKVLGTVLGHQVDAADLYFQHTRSESWVLEDGIIKSGGYNVDHGVGVRAISGEKIGFAYSDDILLPALEQAATAARTIAKKGGDKVLIKSQDKSPVVHTLYDSSDPLLSIPEPDRLQ